MQADTPEWTTLPLLSEVSGIFHGFEAPAGVRHRSGREEARLRLSRLLRQRGTVSFLRQVHGARVAATPWEQPPEADAAVTDAPGQILAIETADCLPLLLVDTRVPRVAAAHAGWRGSGLGVATAAVAAMVERGSRPSDLRVAMGPAIGPCCYQVGREVFDALGPAAAGAFRADGAEHFRLDLPALNRRQLEATGVLPENIRGVGECTRCSPRGYPSYRRDGARAGRLFSLVGLERRG